jgi:hypothetical protein
MRKSMLYLAVILIDAMSEIARIFAGAQRYYKGVYFSE